MDRRKQMLDQHKAVACLARKIAEIYEQAIDAAGQMNLYPGEVERMGIGSACDMEFLAHILNGMDVDVKGDEWTFPVFEASHQTWPLPEVGEALMALDEKIIGREDKILLDQY